MLKRGVVAVLPWRCAVPWQAEAPQQGESPPEHPAATRAPATYRTAEELAAALKKSIEARGNAQSSAPVSSSDQWLINIVRRGQAAGAISHALGTELHYITEGAGTLVTGGTIVRPEKGTPYIEGGVSKRVKVGDVVLIPESTPHWYKEVEGVVTYLEVRFNVPMKQ
jgi:mannose-6-phosphate isomerase-like protein (cupin superfamily)